MSLSEERRREGAKRERRVGGRPYLTIRAAGTEERKRTGTRGGAASQAEEASQQGPNDGERTKQRAQLQQGSSIYWGEGRESFGESTTS